MGIFSRLSDIVSSNIVSMLDRAEDPEKMVRLMIQEMEETLIEVKSAAARLIADKKLLERKADTLLRERDDWKAKAELAIQKQRDDLARAALAEKAKSESARLKLAEELSQCEDQLGKLKEDIHSLTTKLEDARQKQKSIILRRQTAEQQLKVQSTMDRTNAYRAFEKFENYEAQIDRMEGDLEVKRSDWGGKPSLADQFRQLEVDERIEEELSQLKRKHQGVNGEAHDQSITVN